MISVDSVKKQLDFSGRGDVKASLSMAELQAEGVAALCNILEKYKVAYLADEVGLGKTMQALGVIAMLRNEKPNARILIISPREIVQNGWRKEFDNFKSSISRASKLNWEVLSHHNLHDWLGSGLSNNEVSLLRHTSFSRPAFVSSAMPQRHVWRDVCEKWQPVLGGCLQKVGMPLGHKDDFSEACNIALADAIGKYLDQQEIQFDLVIVDEAQCLRNKDNQGNRVLFRILKQRVENWLFISATPTHSGVWNLPVIMNHYPDKEIIPPIKELSNENYTSFMEALDNHMVRRPRTYQLNGHEFNKFHYRNHDSEKLAIHCDTASSILTVALVQKKLVDIVYDPEQTSKPGFFRAGYMACFESLDGAAKRPQPKKQLVQDVDVELESGQNQPDFYQEQQYHSPSDAPDMGFVSELSNRFKKKGFGQHLPHPKIDKVVDDLAVQAFGSENDRIVGGRKTLVFCRRVSSVYALQQRIISRYIEGIEARSIRMWGEKIDWVNGKAGSNDLIVHPEDAQSISDAQEPEIKENSFRLACREGQWLYNFRASFSDGNRNALFFEENWFSVLCTKGNKLVDDAIRAIPNSIRAAAVSFATRNKTILKRRMHRFIVWHCLSHCADTVFGLDCEQKKFWVNTLRCIFSDEIVNSTIDADKTSEKVAVDKSVLVFDSFWSKLDRSPQVTGIFLPSFEGKLTTEAVHERQVLKTILYRYILLSDYLIDLYFSDKKYKSRSLDVFFDWFCSPDVDSARLRMVFKDWIENRALIFRSAYADNRSLAELAKLDSFDYLHGMEPVMAVVGGSGKRDKLLHQFNAPGMPYVVVCTDTLREGVNLHLFCDRVMHFGVAWTAGDLEQRIGRVDRYFSAIERRIAQHILRDDYQEGSKVALPRLDILYPYLRDTLENRQIQVVLWRKDDSEKLTDSSLFVDQRIGMEDIGVENYIIDGADVRKPARTDKQRFSAKKHLPEKKFAKKNLIEFAT